MNEGIFILSVGISLIDPLVLSVSCRQPTVIHRTLEPSKRIKHKRRDAGATAWTFPRART